MRLPDGHTATREYVVHPGAVVVVPLLDDGRVVLERQYRYPVGHVMIEFPAGKLDAGEDPLVCGQRELLEETGYSAREWAHAGAMHLAVAYSTEIIDIWFARGLALGERQLDHGEFLDVIHRHAGRVARLVPRRHRDRRQDPDLRAVAAERPVGRMGTRLAAGAVPRRRPIMPRMKVLNLHCAHGHGFEGWFASNERLRDPARARPGGVPAVRRHGHHQAAERAAPEPRRRAAPAAPKRRRAPAASVACRRAGCARCAR